MWYFVNVGKIVFQKDVLVRKTMCCVTQDAIEAIAVEIALSKIQQVTEMVVKVLHQVISCCHLMEAKLEMYDLEILAQLTIG